MNIFLKPDIFRILWCFRWFLNYVDDPSCYRTLLPYLRGSWMPCRARPGSRARRPSAAARPLPATITLGYGTDDLSIFFLQKLPSVTTQSRVSRLRHGIISRVWQITFADLAAHDVIRYLASPLTSSRGRGRVVKSIGLLTGGAGSTPHEHGHFCKIGKRVLRCQVVRVYL